MVARRSHQKAWVRLAACVELGLLGCCCTLCPVACVAPAWWRAGHAREVHRSYAEVELLSHLAELLMPEEPIAELFRDFPVEPSKSWRARWLCPDITAHGVLKRQGAALFVEYDGHPQHYETKGLQADERKTQALLKYAPPGSCVVRIGHAYRGLTSTKHSMEMVVLDQWRAGHRKSLMEALRQVAVGIMSKLKHALRADACQHLRFFVDTQPCYMFRSAAEFVINAIFISNVEHKKGCRPQVFEGRDSLIGRQHGRPGHQISTPVGMQGQGQAEALSGLAGGCWAEPTTGGQSDCGLSSSLGLQP